MLSPSVPRSSFFLPEHLGDHLKQLRWIVEMVEAWQQFGVCCKKGPFLGFAPEFCNQSEKFSIHQGLKLKKCQFSQVLEQVYEGKF